MSRSLPGSVELIPRAARAATPDAHHRCGDTGMPGITCDDVALTLGATWKHRASGPSGGSRGLAECEAALARFDELPLERPRR